MSLKILPRSSWTASVPGGTIIEAPDEEWLHHTVTVRPRPTRAAEEKLLRAIRSYHLSRDMSDIAYSWAVAPSERIYKLRGQFRSGGHTRGRNFVSYAIVILGNYQVDPLTDGMIESIRWLISRQKQREWIKKGKYPTGGHRDAPGAATSCPGDKAMARMEELRKPWTPPKRFEIQKPNGERVTKNEAETREMTRNFIRRMRKNKSFRVSRVR